MSKALKKNLVGLYQNSGYCCVVSVPPPPLGVGGTVIW